MPGGNAIHFKSILPRGGDQRGAFEELSFLLFAREHRSQGNPIRREGAGGDAGLEGIVADADGSALLGVQAKFFADKMGATQWRDLDESILTALSDNTRDRTLREIVVTLPRNLTQTQAAKWQSFCGKWKREAARLDYPQLITFTLWGETRLRDLLLTTSNRGLLLYYFERPHFDAEYCETLTQMTIACLGDRYQPQLHTSTGTENQLHIFLRSERSRQEYLDAAREKLHDRWLFDEPRNEWPSELHAAYTKANEAWDDVLIQLGDGVSLPASFGALAKSCFAAAETLVSIENGIFPLIPPREQTREDHYVNYRSPHPNEEILNRVDRWRRSLNSFGSYLQKNLLADSSCLLFSGGPGTGKTHVLAEVCSRYASEGGIVLFIEGATFSTSDPVWLQLIRWARLDNLNFRDFLVTLSAIADHTMMPALICIDALNETPDRNLWRVGLEAFATDVRAVSGVKLIVSCRDDYLKQTLPYALASRRIDGWAFAEHEGLGLSVFEAFPKYIAAYEVHWDGLPPLSSEFQNPLFLRTFCEAYARQTPEPGLLSVATILRAFARRKSESIGRQIDCDPGQVVSALRALAEAMLELGRLQISDSVAREICLRHHAPTESSKSLYRALLSEDVLAEIPGPEDELGSKGLVRFTYERVWDYFVASRLLAVGTEPSPTLLTQLRDRQWRRANAGVVSLLLVRCAEEENGELLDLISDNELHDYDLIELFLDSLSWRTQRSVSARTWELFSEFVSQDHVAHELDYLIPLSSNPQHPWNAQWLHERLLKMRIAERDRWWTFWVNEQFLGDYEQSSLHELISWAERAHLKLLSDEHVLLLAIILAWTASTTVPESRKRLAATLTRLVAERTRVAARLVEKFLPADDPYVREWVMLAAAGSAQHAIVGDRDLGQLARVVYDGIFARSDIEPHVFVRHYATEVCEQARTKNVLPSYIEARSFNPPFRSHWPRIWSESKYLRQSEKCGRPTLFKSVEPGPEPGYGDWGRYVMAGYVHNFQSKRLCEAPAAPSRHSRYDSRIAKRFIVQRVFEFGWDANARDLHPSFDYTSSRDTLERLSKKYQWIALYEFLGFLSDHYHFLDFRGRVRPYLSARQLDISALLDPFIVAPPPDNSDAPWNFAPPKSPWWRGGLDPLPRPLSTVRQREVSEERKSLQPLKLLALNDGTRDWLTLSAFHLWYEPVPVWHGTHSTPHVGMEWAIQSYLVPPKQMKTLVSHLNEQGFSNNSRRWLEEPEFGQSLAALYTFPLEQAKLRQRCKVDKMWDTEGWDTGALSTTCRCAPDEEQRRAREGSMPSPQLADFGNLRWLGRSYEFAPHGKTEAVVRHLGEGFRGACIAHTDAVKQWVEKSGLRLVWRVYCFKYLLSERSGENHARDYWSTFVLQPSGKIICSGGATRAYPNGPGPEELLPWMH